MSMRASTLSTRIRGATSAPFGCATSRSCTPLQTNLAGNGEALNVVTPAQVPPSAHNTVNGIIWQVMDVATGAVEYKTGCVVVAVD
jgi:hypothetical protein